MAGAHLASRPKRRALRSVPGETPRIPPQPRMPRAGHRDRSTASIDHRHRKIPPAFASNHLRSIRHYGIRMESERRRIGEVLRSIQVRQSDLRLRSRDPDGPDEQTHPTLLLGEDMLDARTDFGFGVVGAPDRFRHRAPLRPLTMDMADEAVPFHELLVG